MRSVGSGAPGHWLDQKGGQLVPCWVLGLRGGCSWCLGVFWISGGKFSTWFLLGSQKISVGILVAKSLSWSFGE